MKNVVIIGAGIVGLATAYQLLHSKLDVKVSVVEKEPLIAQHQTGHNSGVIHSGIYYKPGSLKAINCIRGYKLLLDFCKENGINYELCGKIIVATDPVEEIGLNKIYEHGISNGLKGISVLDKEQIKEKEPYCVGTKAVYLPQSGIIDYKEVSQKLFELISSEDAEVCLGSKVDGFVRRGNRIVVQSDKKEFLADLVINCAGLYSDRLFEKSTDKKAAYKILPFRGEYYELKPEAHHYVNGLIYPVPNPEFPFLGVHFTKMIQGGVEAGPNAVLAYAREGYSKSEISISELMETLTYKGFHSIVRRYWKEGAYEFIRSYSKTVFVNSMQKLVPEISSKHVIRGGAGVRAQAVYPDGNMIDDFVIDISRGVINVCNAPSPAATSCLAIGETVVNSIKRIINN